MPEPIDPGVNFLDELETILPLMQKQQVKARSTWKGWKFTTYFGPDPYAKGNCIRLQWSMTGTAPATSIYRPTIPSDGSAIMFETQTRVTATWTATTQEALAAIVESSFSEDSLHFTGVPS